MKVIRHVFVITVFMLLFSCTKKSAENKTFTTHFEQSNGEETATYQQVIEFYEQLALASPKISIKTIGETDSGLPLHLVIFSDNQYFNFSTLDSTTTKILINNGIHPGESDGIDATMLLFRDLISGTIASPKNTILATIPVYNIGGALNRNSTSRANQNGPSAYGFRGNMNNYDLNRDFIKTDTKNMQAFAQIFHTVNPDIFIDNHVSNGADYQYTLTHLFTQHNKLGGKLGTYLHEQLMPNLENSLASINWDITPYVNVFNEVPEKGFSQFFDHPRYSTGYSTLFNSLGMMVETHMLKPYKNRVNGTYQLMLQMIKIAEKDGALIKKIRKNASTQHLNWKHYPITWAIDTTQSSLLSFKGFEADRITSEVTGFQRLKYDKSRPFTKTVSYQNQYKAVDSIEVPKAYVIQKRLSKVQKLLAINNIQFTKLKKDSTITVEGYKIADYQTSKRPYEGHYPHYNTKVSRHVATITFNQGDIVVPTNQKGIRYLLETLEPAAHDSFFNWNFFDVILQQKEGFSPYVFEDEALKMLQNDETLNAEFQLKKAEDEAFATSWYAQLDWLFKKSVHYEAAHLQYPIYRIMK